MTLAAGAAATQPGRTGRPPIMTTASVRYSPLTQVNAGNVKNLTQVWIYHLKPNGFTGRLRYDESIPDRHRQHPVSWARPMAK